MVTLHEARSCVVAICRGYASVEDLNRLFMWLRQKETIRDTVRDVGDFWSHSDARDEGRTFKYVRALYATFVFHFNLQHDRAPTKQQMIDQFEAAMLLAPANWSKQKINVPRREAHRVLKDIGQRIQSITLEKVKFSPPLSETEAKVYDLYVGTHAWKPAFTQQELEDDLVYALVRLEILQKSEIEDFRKSSNFIALFVIVRMHLVVMDLGKGEPKFHLYAGISYYRDGPAIPYMTVYAALDLPADDPVETFMQPIFETRIPMMDRYVDGSARIFLENLEPILRYPIRLTEDRTIRIVV